MRIAVLSDIHGNLPALEAVLTDIQDNNMDEIVILGDMITDFSQYTNDVLNRIRSLSAYVIRGTGKGTCLTRRTIRKTRHGTTTYSSHPSGIRSIGCPPKNVRTFVTCHSSCR